MFFSNFTKFITKSAFVFRSKGKVVETEVISCKKLRLITAKATAYRAFEKSYDNLLSQPLKLPASGNSAPTTGPTAKATEITIRAFTLCDDLFLSRDMIDE